MIPGERFIKDGEIELNAGRRTVTLTVANTGDRPIQVGSHYHFFETNPALLFERAPSRGHRLNIPAGTAVRFEPGQSREVELVAYAGERSVYGFRGEVMGQLDGATGPTKGASKGPAKRPTKKKAAAKSAAKPASKHGKPGGRR